MDVVIKYAEIWSVSPFEILQQDVDNFLLVTNSMIKRGKSSSLSSSPSKSRKYDETVNPKTKSKDVRIHVNDRTATNGWF